MARWGFLFGVILAVWPRLAPADMIDTSGLQPWEACALCHGIDGVSRMAKFPRLAAQPEGYLAKQLQDFRSAHRQNDDNVMMDNAALLSPTQVRIVARYFSEQEAPGPIDSTEATAHAAGGALFNAGRPRENLSACASCHVEGDPAANYPAITAQHPSYIEKQLRDFKEGRRQNDPDGVMQRVAAKLSAQDITAVAAYAGSLPRQKRSQP
ncbi:MAG: cytochrome C [Rhodospirillaceae bacterium]|jgi:cytochrome c553|nr:cytochrome C [Rhodospirillaceae bacterium]|tara:strand:- start:183 stop:812 length:630 start_codon:yes stop_codon:yes gene_type:complete